MDIATQYPMELMYPLMYIAGIILNLNSNLTHNARKKEPATQTASKNMMIKTLRSHIISGFPFGIFINISFPHLRFCTPTPPAGNLSPYNSDMSEKKENIFSAKFPIGFTIMINGRIFISKWHFISPEKIK